MSDGQVCLNDIFRYEISGHAVNGTVTGEFKLVNQPKNLGRFHKRGIRVEEIF
jgi:hypothetical protein